MIENEAVSPQNICYIFAIGIGNIVDQLDDRDRISLCYGSNRCGTVVDITSNFILDCFTGNIGCVWMLPIHHDLIVHIVFIQLCCKV